MTGDQIFQAKSINLNTIIAAVTLLVMFTGYITIWNKIQFKQEEADRWQQDHMQLHEKMTADYAARRATTDAINAQQQEILNKLVAGQEQLTYRVTLNEKGVEGNIERMGRAADFNGNQFTELRAQMNSISVQLALANDSLKRLENLDSGRSKLMPQSYPNFQLGPSYLRPMEATK